MTSSAAVFFLFLLHSLFYANNPASATSCVSCSWSGVEHPSKACSYEDVSNLSDSEKLYVRKVNCGAQNCVIRRVLNAGGAIHSVMRGCSVKAPQTTKCSSDVYFKTCETVCSEDECNVKGENPPKAPASGRRPTKSSRPRNGAERSMSGFAIVSSVAVVAVWIFAMS